VLLTKQVSNAASVTRRAFVVGTTVGAKTVDASATPACPRVFSPQHISSVGVVFVTMHAWYAPTPSSAAVPAATT
jgi:hypothetical protein